MEGMNMNFSLLGMWTSMDWVARGVVIGLVFIVFVLAVIAFIWSQRRGGEPRRPRRAPAPAGPKMALPKSRGRR